MQRDAMRRVCIALPVFVLAIGGCRPLYVGNDGISNRPPAPRVPTSPRPGRNPAVTDSAAIVPLESKRVRSKEEPVTLYAHDGSSCTVSEQRFREIIVGQTVRCGWR